jgi:hypothetical protein
MLVLYNMLFHPRQSGLSNFCGGDGSENFEAGGEYVGPGDQRGIAQISGR